MKPGGIWDRVATAIVIADAIWHIWTFLSTSLCAQTLTNDSLERKQRQVQSSEKSLEIMKSHEKEFHPIGSYTSSSPYDFSTKSDSSYGPYGELKSTGLPVHYPWSVTTYQGRYGIQTLFNGVPFETYTYPGAPLPRPREREARKAR